MTERKPGLDSAYALDGPESNNRLYADWADTYDATFARDMDYRMPQHVAQLYAELGGEGPVLDIGAGTGLVAEALAMHGIAPVDATDLSPEMLEVARQKGCYRDLFAGDVTARLPREDDAFAGAVSAGTYTVGHVGAEGLDEVVRLVRPGGLCVLAVNARHWGPGGFDAGFARLEGRIAGFETRERRYYGDKATGEHSDSVGQVAVFRVA